MYPITIFFVSIVPYIISVLLFFILDMKNIKTKKRLRRINDIIFHVLTEKEIYYIDEERITLLEPKKIVFESYNGRENLLSEFRTENGYDYPTHKKFARNITQANELVKSHFISKILSC